MKIGKPAFSLKTTTIQVQPSGERTFVTFTSLSLTDEDTELEDQVNESLTLQLVPTPATLRMMPIGEGVFFKQELPLIIMDINRKLKYYN